MNKDVFVRKFAENFAKKLKENAPRDNGELGDAFVDTLELDGYKLTFVLPYHWKPVEYGSLPHIIEAKPGSALFWKGAKHPVKRVLHPGNKPTFFIRNTVQNDMADVIVDTIKSFK